jgi:hypothetical protein
MKMRVGRRLGRLGAVLCILLAIGQMRVIDSYAQTTGGCDPSNPATCVSSGGSSGDPFGSIDQTLQGLTGQLNQLQQQGATYMNQFQNMSNQYLNMGNSFEGQFQDLNTNLANMTTTANKALALAQNKGNAFGMALAAGGGAALGAEGASLAFEGGKKLVEKLLEKAHLYDFHKLDKNERGAAYQKELIDYTDREGASAGTQASIDSLLKFLNAKDQKGNGFTGGTYLQMRSELNFLKESADDVANSALEYVHSPDPKVRHFGLATRAACVTAKQTWQDVQDRIGNKSVDALCTEMDSAVRKAKDSESYLQVERAGLLVRYVDNVDYLKVTDDKLFKEDQRIASKRFQSRLQQAMAKLDKHDEKLSQNEIKRKADVLNSTCNASLKKGRVSSSDAGPFCERISKLSSVSVKGRSPEVQVAQLSPDEQNYMGKFENLSGQRNALANDVDDYNKNRDDNADSRTDLANTIQEANLHGGTGTNPLTRSVPIKNYQDMVNGMLKAMYSDVQSDRMNSLDSTAVQVKSTCDRLRSEQQAAFSASVNGFNTLGQAPAATQAEAPAAAPPAN